MMNYTNIEQHSFVSSKEWYEGNTAADQEKDAHTQIIASLASLAAIFAGCLAAVL